MSDSTERLEEILRGLRGDVAIAQQVERIAEVGSFVSDPQGRGVAWSAEMRRIVGLGPDDAPSIELLMARVVPQDRERAFNTVRAAVESGGSFALYHGLLWPSGELRHVYVRGEMVMLEGYERPVLVGALRDITAPVRDRERLARQHEELQSAKQKLLLLAQENAMAVMASTLAHEINQPLTTIANYAAALQHIPFTEEARPRITEFLRELGKGAHRAGAIIRRMRDYVERGTVLREPVAIEQVIHDACKHFRFEEGARLHVEAEGAGRVMIDAVQIEQVLVNLIRNAIEANAETGAHDVTITACATEDQLTVSVIDQGEGIDRAQLPQLFESGGSTKAGGMGVGLSISKTIVQAHGGTIWAENLEQGARFAFRLPLGGTAG